jgi:hypothetical protein
MRHLVSKWPTLKGCSRLTAQLERLNNAISALSGMGGGGRVRIGAVQRARWAKSKRPKVVSIARSGRRKLSAAALANIRAAQKARWAKWRKAKKTG